MKKVILAIVSLILLASCGNDKTKDAEQNDFVGVWQMVNMELIESKTNSQEAQEIIQGYRQWKQIKDKVTTLLYLKKEGTFEKTISYEGQSITVSMGTWRYEKNSKTLIQNVEYTINDDGTSLRKTDEKTIGVLTKFQSGIHAKITFITEVEGVSLQSEYKEN